MTYRIDAQRAHAEDERTDDAAAMTPSALRTVDTHWTRILHYDIFTSDADDIASDPVDGLGAGPGSPDRGRRARDEAPHRYSVEIFAAAEDSGREADPHDVGFPITAVAILLGIYVVVCLAVAGLVHVLFPSNAAAAIHSGSPIPSLALIASTVIAWPIRASLRPSSKTVRDLQEGTYPHVD